MSEHIVKVNDYWVNKNMIDHSISHVTISIYDDYFTFFFKKSYGQTIIILKMVTVLLKD